MLALSPRELRTLVRRHVLQERRVASCDLDQTPGFVGVTEYVPTLVWHGTLYMMGDPERVFVGDEELVSQGLDLYGHGPAAPVWGGGAWAGLSETNKNDLAGKTINACLFASTIGFVMPVAVPVPSPTSLSELHPVPLGRPAAKARDARDDGREDGRKRTRVAEEI